jgi:uncharacterized protein
MTNPIGALFSRSPIGPLERHMEKAQNCVMLLGDLLEIGLNGDWGEAQKIGDKIIEAEQQADEIKRDIRTSLPKSIFLPVARTDFLELLRAQDRLANRSKEIANVLLLRKMLLPEQLTTPLRNYFETARVASEQAKKAINELDELLETGFGGKEAEFVESLIDELDQIELKSESSQLQLNSLLYQYEQEIPPVDVMFLYKLIDLIGDIAEISQKIGSRLLLMLAK